MSLERFPPVLLALRSLAVLAALAVLLAAVPHREPAAAEPGLLSQVQERGYVRCGVHRSGVGLAEIRADGAWAGYFVELCRVVALAAVGDSHAIRVYEVDDASTALALDERLVDVVLSTIRQDNAPDGHSLGGGSPDGMPPDGVSPDGVSPDGVSPDGVSPDGVFPDGGIAYLSPILEDEQMLVSFEDGIDGVADLPPGARICASAHPTVQRNLRAALGERIGLVEVVEYRSIDGLFNAFFRQRCDAVTHHHYAILAQSLLRSPQRSPIWQSVFGLGRISFVPAVRADDAEWSALVDAAVRIALHVPGGDAADVPPAVRDGAVERIRAISNASSAIYDRTLGHMGGQGFYPAAAPLPRHDS